MPNKIKFKGKIFNGDMDLNKTEMVCVPSKPQYAEVDLCLKDGFNIVIGQILNNCLSFDEKKKLGNEIEKRWNGYAAIKKENEKLLKALKDIQNHVKLIGPQTYQMSATYVIATRAIGGE